MSDKTPVRLRVNGIDYDMVVEPRRSLADALHEDCGLTGTHLRAPRRGPVRVVRCSEQSAAALAANKWQIRKS